MQKPTRHPCVSVFLFLIITSGCVWLERSSGIPYASLESTVTALSEESRGLLDVSLPACVRASDAFEIAYVTRVIDGDSIAVELNGKSEQVRYVGINAPEYDGGEWKEAEQATQFNRDLVEGRYVLLIKDVSERDKYGRLLRYVFTGTHFVNYELVRQGVAEAREYPPDTACQPYFQQAE